MKYGAKWSTMAATSAPKRKASSGSVKGGTSVPSSHNVKKAKKRSSSAVSAHGQAHPVNVKQRKHADIVVDGKRIWNQLRLKTNTPEQTRALVDELMPLVLGKASELAMQHDASRVVQAAIQFGSVAERKQILKELCLQKEGGNSGASSSCLVELSKSQYAHFVVLKVFKYCHQKKDDYCLPFIVGAFKGHMAKLAAHATASRVVEALFQTFPPKDTNILKQEFYGPHFSIFAADILEQLSQQKQTQT